MKTTDLDPSGGGIGFTEGCPGCRALVMGTKRTGHDEKCRLRVMESISQNTSGEARVKTARAREDEWQAKKLERSFAKKAAKEKPEVAQGSTAESSSSSGPAQKDSTVPDGSQQPSTSSSSKGQKRSADGDGDQDQDRIALGPYLTKRPAEEEVGGEASRPRKVGDDMEQDGSGVSRKRHTDTRFPSEEGPAGVRQKVREWGM